MAEQFEVTQQEKEYRPTQATNFVREFDNYIAERDALNKPYEASVNARARQAVQDADKQVREWSEIARLSKTLSNQLMEIQKTKNEEEYAQGLADQLMDAPDLLGQQELEADEASLIAGQKVATDTASKYLAEGGSEGNAREIRNTGGWYGYGRFVGQLQQMGDGYGMALEEAKGSFTVNLGGEDLSYDQLTTKDEYNAWQRAFNANYLKGVPRTNGDVVEKYVLRSMRSAANSDRLKWNKEYEKNRKAEETEARQMEFVGSLNRGDTTIAERAFATYPGSKREIRGEIEDNLIIAVDAGYMTAGEALNFYETQTIVKDGKRQTMAEAFPLQYRQFSDAVEKARTKENNEYTAGLKNDATELMQTINSGETLSDDQVQQLMDSDRYKNNPLARGVLKDYQTREEIEDDSARAHLDALYRTGDLTPEVLKKYNNGIQQEYASKAEETATIEGEYDSKAAAIDANGAAIQLLNITQGTGAAKNDFEYQTIYRNALDLHKRSYQEARRAGKNHGEAMEYARQQVKATVDMGSEANPLKADPKPITLDSSVKTTRKALDKNPNLLNTTVLADTPKGALTESFEYLRTGRGNMSGFYQALAQGQPYTAEDIVLAQAKAAGMDISKIEKNPTRQAQEKLPPHIKRLIKVSPNSRTFAQGAVRAVLGGEDTKYFLDTVASKESEAYGGYDAYNLGGSNGGHTAHGSGNSAEDNQFGKPVSQLTIGEIKALHRAGKAHAMGRYQFIGSTFAEVAPLTGLPDDAVFNAKTQDLFAITRLIQRASWGSLQSGLASEWIGLQYLNSAQYQRLVQAAYGAIEENK